MTREESIKALCEKSGRSLSAAEILIEHGDFDFAVSRTYYSMFYLAEALLMSEGKSYSSHAAVMAAVYRGFVSTGKLPRNMHSILHKAFDLRQQGDYLSGVIIDEGTAREMLVSAREFMRIALELLA